MKKIYYSISEVCERLGLKPHIIRYWETEFPRLKTKTKKGHSRKYTENDIEFLSFVKDLIYIRKFTLSGAKAEIKKMKRVDNAHNESDSKPKTWGEIQQMLAMVEDADRHETFDNTIMDAFSEPISSTNSYITSLKQLKVELLEIKKILLYRKGSE
jgi:DNA-binding transcriptional MerR regulator